MLRLSMLAWCALLGSAAPLRAQRMTEQYIPIGRSPGVSGTSYSVIGTIEAVDLGERTVRIAGPQGPVMVSFSDTTHIWIDRSAQGRTALVGSPSDLVVGRRAEAKFPSHEGRGIAEWIKVAIAAGGDDGGAVSGGARSRSIAQNSRRGAAETARRRSRNMEEPLTVVFDLGGVLIDWNPRYLYRRLIDDEAAVEHFLASVCTQAWNETFDAGRAFAEGVAELCARHPAQAELIEAFDRRWLEMVRGPIDGAVRQLEALARAGTPLFALSNWSAEKFPHVRARYAFFDHFHAIVISGEIGVIKPDPRAFDALLERTGRPPEQCLFIDDSETNVRAADRLGFRTIHFEGPEQLGQALSAHGLPHA